MRPTELQFKHPKENTPDFHEQLVTCDGRRLNFPTPTQIHYNDSRKGPTTSFGKEDRFPQYKFWAKINIQGPGSYNDHASFITQKKKPCSANYKSTVVPGKQTGKSSYFYSGNHICYEPRFGQHEQKQNLQRLNLSHFPVNIEASFNKETVSSLRRRSLIQQKNAAPSLERLSQAKSPCQKSKYSRYIKVGNELLKCSSSNHKRSNNFDSTTPKKVYESESTKTSKHNLQSYVMEGPIRSQSNLANTMILSSEGTTSLEGNNLAQPLSETELHQITPQKIRNIKKSNGRPKSAADFARIRKSFETQALKPLSLLGIYGDIGTFMKQMKVQSQLSKKKRKKSAIKSKQHISQD